MSWCLVPIFYLCPLISWNNFLHLLIASSTTTNTLKCYWSWWIFACFKSRISRKHQRLTVFLKSKNNKERFVKYYNKKHLKKVVKQFHDLKYFLDNIWKNIKREFIYPCCVLLFSQFSSYGLNSFWKYIDILFTELNSNAFWGFAPWLDMMLWKTQV